MLDGPSQMYMSLPQAHMQPMGVPNTYHSYIVDESTPFQRY